MKTYLKYTLVAFACGLVLSCATSTTTGSVGVDRKQLLLIPSSQIQQAAATNYTQVLQKAKQTGVLNSDPILTKRVRAIGKRLIPQVGVYRADAVQWNWQINVIKENQLNAWCMPGGKIVFYSGIIETLRLTDDEIAAIMGHEMAHALREHGRERASEAYLKQSGLKLARIAGISTKTLQLTDLVSNVTLTLPNSRTHETEADRMGVELAARAGYDPAAAVRVWKKMKSRSRNAQPEILSTHPAHDTRIEDLKVYAARVQNLYLQAKARQKN